MAPKEDSHAERINVMESQIGGLTVAFEEMRKAAEAREQRAFEAEKRAEERERHAEERHQQSMAVKEKPPDAKSELNPSSEKLGSKTLTTKETQRSTTDGSNQPVKGLQPRPEKRLLQLPESATPLRSAEILPSLTGAGSSGGSPRQKFETSPKKLDLPDFEGKNPDDWIFRVEKCFKVNQTKEEEKLSVAMACMTGCAVTWLRMIQDRDELLDWRDFKMKLKKRFKPTRGGTILSQMLQLRQTGSISEYRDQFEELSAEVPHVTDDVLEELFLHGMKRSLREQVVRLSPVGMDEIIDMAKIIEEQENERNAYHLRSFHRTNSAPALGSNQRNSN